MGINCKLTPVQITHASSWLSGSTEYRLIEHHSSWIPSKFPKLDIGLLTDCYCLRDAVSHVSRPPSPSPSAIHPMPASKTLPASSPIKHEFSVHYRAATAIIRPGTLPISCFIFFCLQQVESTRIVIRHAYQCCTGLLVLMTQVRLFDVWRTRRNISPDLRCEQE